jgi:LytS/YehU family sensor histidine kinase
LPAHRQRYWQRLHYPIAFYPARPDVIKPLDGSLDFLRQHISSWRYAVQLFQGSQAILLPVIGQDKDQSGISFQLDPYQDYFRITSAVVVPLRIEGVIVGTLSLYRSNDGHAFTAEDQVFLNICLNSIDPMQPEGGQLSVGILLSGDGQFAGVKFHDTGPGISPDKIPRLFETFFTTKPKGLGLGMAICYDIVNQHKGRIEVESRVGEGTTFIVWLPVLKNQAGIG